MGIIDNSQRLKNSVMTPQAKFSPVSLRYIAALRGNKPKKTGIGFTYGEMGCIAPERLICLAASNPEGRFYGLVKDEKARRAAEELATQRGIFNVVFLVGAPSEIMGRLSNGSSLPPMLDYLCCDDSNEVLTESERTALFDIADKRLNPGGLFVISYKTRHEDNDTLRFLVKELTPEMNEGQKEEFLGEIKQLGGLYFAKNPSLAERLNQAITHKKPEEFTSFFENKATSPTFDTVVAMGKRSFAYAGDAKLASNYVELVVPKAAQDLIVACRNNPLYEVIKDFALDRTLRSDIWIKAPLNPSANPVELFGGFAYGTVFPRTQIPAAYAAQGKVIDLSQPLYTKLIDLMSIMPIGVGDVLAHPTSKDEKPEKILEALQILVACGFANPMRGTLITTNNASVTQPRLVGSFNRYLDKISLIDNDVLFASQVAGFGISLPVREAFVMQAINRAGLNNSVSALMPELRRIADTPLASSVMKSKEPTAEMAHDLIVDIVGTSLPKWYAYALLEAA